MKYQGPLSTLKYIYIYSLVKYVDFMCSAVWETLPVNMRLMNGQ